MSERRVPERTRTFLRGKIEFSDGQVSLDCLVRDLSESGARLSLSDSVSLPDSFDLVIAKTGRASRVVTRWRRGDQIGVEFRELPVAAKKPPASGDAYVLELEAEIVRLKRVLEELRADPGKIQILLDRAL